jgi:ribonuclease-3
MADEAGSALERALGHEFSNLSLLQTALVHRSHTSEGEAEQSNERLEFLGDAVLSLVVSDELYGAWDLDEGSMAKVRAAVVNEASLASVARSLGVGAALVLGRGEDTSGGRDKASILADAMEAILGALYLDGGLEAVRSLILRKWGSLIEERAAAPGGRDYKTRLQEVLASGGEAPDYEVEGSGPDHRRVFRAEVSVAGRSLGSGWGTSKKRAQQAAAREALEALGAGDA